MRSDVHRRRADPASTLRASSWRIFYFNYPADRLTNGAVFGASPHERGEGAMT